MTNTGALLRYDHSYIFSRMYASQGLESEDDGVGGRDSVRNPSCTVE